MAISAKDLEVRVCDILGTADMYDVKDPTDLNALEAAGFGEDNEWLLTNHARDIGYVQCAAESKGITTAELLKRYAKRCKL